MDETSFDRYARITPFVIVAAVILGYLIAGGIWWGIPIVGVFGLLYAVINVRIRRLLNRHIVRKIRRR